ncbi:uncharacterized protein NEMAJ01_0288 [Nematocida major]|uniref:uncharacterized protein n=1 Tax=Nematocida major TaxID=1912982 RepID=UPI002008C21F|nr:uncharacterized protein NEMAJ01_0288 [Nematocida major]KAH9385392.1 hypothetical protein NEMAJ01_0288 [Nematocida major]
MFNRSVFYAIAGEEEEMQPVRMEAGGIECFRVQRDYVVISGMQAGCTCCEHTICAHILSVIKSAHADSDVLAGILKSIVRKAAGLAPHL